MECGNTFQKADLTVHNVVECPVCDAVYSVEITGGKLYLKDFMFEEKIPLIFW